MDVRGTTRDIGVPYTREYLESLGAIFSFQKEMVEVGPGVYLTGFSFFLRFLLFFDSF